MDSLNGVRVDGLLNTHLESLDSFVTIVTAIKNNGLYLKPETGAIFKLNLIATRCFEDLRNCEMSLAFWVRLDGKNANNVMYIAGEAFRLTVWQTNGNTCPCQVAFELNGKIDEPSANRFTLDGWNHLALTWVGASSSGTVTYYQDGALHHTRSVSGAMPSQSSIDKDHIKYLSDGVGITMDDLWGWSVRLEDADIQALYDTY